MFNFDNSYVQLPDFFYSKVLPTAVKNPEIIVFNNSLAQSLELDFNKLSRDKMARLLSGNDIPDGAMPLAQAYAGHQFGHLTMLGDGRAHLLGEHVLSASERFDIQFKGSGKTPYSRSGDGRAGLGPMLREYIISEAMYALGIPTTRSLAVVKTGEPVYRATALAGAVLTRVALSHLRIGTFEYALYANQSEAEFSKVLLAYAIDRHYPFCKQADCPVIAFLAAVMQSQIRLVVNWMRVGFIHGVMNTDNMSIAGETIDYGPCAFMNAYDPKTVFSSIDRSGRYAFGNQPQIIQWNLARLAEALLPLIDSNADKAIEKAKTVLDHFQSEYQSQWLDMMGKKLGFKGNDPKDIVLINELLDWMACNRIDYTNFFIDLTTAENIKKAPYQDPIFQQWHKSWQSRIGKTEAELSKSIVLMKSVNPVVIPRNHRVEEAITAALASDIQPLQDLLSVLRTPYCDRQGIVKYQQPPEFGDQGYKTYCGT